MFTRENVEIDAVQTKVVDVLHLIVSVLGVVAVTVGAFRAMAIGDRRPVMISGAIVVLVVICFFLRRRVSKFFRAILLLSGLMLVGLSALWNFGVAAAAGILVPTVIVLAWLIWKRSHAIYFTLLGGVGLIVVAYKNLAFGSEIDGNLVGYNRTPIFWINISILYMGIGLMILGVVRVLFGAFRSALARARDREVESKADKERLAGILQGVNDAIFLHDPTSGQILEVFGSYDEMYGYSREKILTVGIGRLSAQFGDWTEESARDWMRMCRDEGAQSFTWRAKRADGSLFWAAVSMRPIILDKLERILVTVRDVDLMMHDQLELASLNADLERRVLLRTAEIQREREASDAFAYTVSHDLRAPLRAIDGYSRILLEDFGEALPEEARKYLGRMMIGAERMARLVDALLALSRLDRQKIEKTSVDMSRVVEEIRQELMDAGNCRVRIDGGNAVEWVVGSLPRVHSDPDLAKQIFANLLGNACKFTQGTAFPRISVKTLPRSDGVWFEIADNGSGFDMSYSDKLFKVFQRLHPDSIEGIGIGLATVKKILDRLGGAIEAEGMPGEGATFRFRLEPAKTESVNPA